MKKIFVLFVFGVFLITGCGGSGGSGTGSTASSLSYTGSTSQAVVDNSNANDIASNAYQGGSSGFVALGTDLESPGANSLSSNRSGAPGYFRIATFLTDSVKRNISLADDGIHAQATKSITQTEVGTCGGSITIDLTGDTSTGTVSGTLAETNYCSYGTTGNGTITVTGTFDPISGNITKLTISTSSFSVKSGSDSFTMSGTMTASFSGSTGTIVMNFLVQDNATLKVFKIENFNISAIYGVSFIDISMSGRFFDPDYGYVDISTPTAFTIANNATWPSAGVMILTGQNSGAKFSAISTSLYQIEVDADGNGTYETNMGTFGWASI